jgi:hypothetical protein
VYSNEAVARVWSPDLSASGCAILPKDTCAAQFFVGKNHNREDHELMGPDRMIQRFSPGSEPLNPLASSFIFL